MIKLEINLTNKWLYTLIAVGIVLLLGIGVYAYTQQIPNPGHGGNTVLVSINDFAGGNRSGVSC